MVRASEGGLMRSIPYSLLLRAVPWEIFGTLTWRGEPPRVETALAIGIRFLEGVRRKLRYPDREWFFFLRGERGEAGGRVHLHVLVHVRPVDIAWFCPGPGLLPAVHRMWGRGRTQHRRLHDLGAAAVPYMLKDTSGGDQYEIGKSAGAVNSVPSSALVRRALLQQSEGECFGAARESSVSTLGNVSSACVRDRRLRSGGSVPG